MSLLHLQTASLRAQLEGAPCNTLYSPLHQGSPLGRLGRATMGTVHTENDSASPSTAPHPGTQGSAPVASGSKGHQLQRMQYTEHVLPGS